MVGMERFTRDDPPAIDDLLVGDILDGRVAGDVAFFLVMGMKLAEQLRSGLKLIRSKVLVSHDEDVMFGKGALEGGARLNVDRLGEVEPGDFGAGVIGQGRDGKGDHGMILSPERASSVLNRSISVNLVVEQPFAPSS